MSYDIYIGNATLGTFELEDGQYYVIWDGITINHHQAPDAPVFPNDEMSGNGNSRHPGYSQWGEFCDIAGVRALFFDKEQGIMRHHPGTFSITQHHLDEITEARTTWIADHPNTIPGFTEEHDGILARLLWLEWWFRWALAHCDRPAIHNH